VQLSQTFNKNDMLFWNITLLCLLYSVTIWVCAFLRYWIGLGSVFRKCLCHRDRP